MSGDSLSAYDNGRGQKSDSALRLGSQCNVYSETERSETNLLQCEQEQVLLCIAGVTSFTSGAK